VGDSFVIEVDDPRTDDVRALLERHLAFMRRQSPPEDVHALDVDGLRAQSVTFFSLRAPDGELLAVGALKELDRAHGELKSMHTVEGVRRRGVGRAMLDHLLDRARARGYERVSLETGTMDGFTPARSLYESVGFERCLPFADYPASPHSVCMTLALTPEAEAPPGGGPPAGGRGPRS
jgi:putative acetyltransferase